MARVFNFANYLMSRESAIIYKDPNPLPDVAFQDLIRQKLGDESLFRQLLSEMPEQQRESEIAKRKQAINELMQSYILSLQSPADIGHAFVNVKSPEERYMEANRQFSQLSKAIETLGKDKSASAKEIIPIVEEVFGQNLSVFKQKAFEYFKLKFLPSLIELYKGKVQKAPIQEIVDGFEKLNLTLQSVDAFLQKIWRNDPAKNTQIAEQKNWLETATGQSKMSEFPYLSEILQLNPGAESDIQNTILDFVYEIKDGLKTRETVYTIARGLRQDYFENAVDMFLRHKESMKEKLMSLWGSDPTASTKIETQLAWLLMSDNSVKFNNLPFYPDIVSASGLDESSVAKVINDLITENNSTTFAKVTNLLAENPASLFAAQTSESFIKTYGEEAAKTLVDISAKTEGRFNKEAILTEIGLSRTSFPMSPTSLFDMSFDESKFERPTESLSPQEVIIERMKQARRNPINLQILKDLLFQGGYAGPGINPDDAKSISHILEALPAEMDEQSLSQWSEVQRQILEGKSFSDLGIQSNEDMSPSNYVDRMLRYILVTMCHNTHSNLEEMLVSTGMFSSDEASKFLGKRVLEDDRYHADYKKVLGSGKEKECVDTLRRYFNLEVIPSNMGMPILDGCNINSRGFKIDLMIIASAVRNWYTSEDNMAHPDIEPETTFIGEYFGYDDDLPKGAEVFSENGLLGSNGSEEELQKLKEIIARYKLQTIQPSMYGGLVGIDGDIANVELPDHRNIPLGTKSPRVQVPALSGTPVTGGTLYNVRTQWKKMTEDFYATSMGSNAIYLDQNLRPENIMKELNRCNIIYKFNNSVQNGSPLSFVNQHIFKPEKSCDLCLSKYHDSNISGNASPESMQFNKEYTRAEAYIMSAITELKMSMVILPVMQAERMKILANQSKFSKFSDYPSLKEYFEAFHSSEDMMDLETKGFGRHEVYNYYSKKQQIYNKINELKNSGQYDLNAETQFRMQLKAIEDEHLSFIKTKINNYASVNSDYQKALSALQNLLSQAKTMKDSDVFTQVQSIYKAYDPATQKEIKQRTASINNILFKIAIKC